MTDTGEDIAEEYLRLNGFFLIRRFTVHYKCKNPSDVDLIGVRMPNSAEIVEDEMDSSQSVLFEDDPKLLKQLSSDGISILIGEVTLSSKRREIEERVNKLKDMSRLKYVLRRFGIWTNEALNALIEGAVVDTHIFRAKLTRVMFVHTERIVERFQKEHPELLFISWSRAQDFVKRRASYKIKSRGVQNLPRNIRMFIRSRQS